MTTTTTNPIEAVRARLDGGNRWIKGSLDDDAGGLCVVGACIDRDSMDLLDAVAAEMFPDRLGMIGLNGMAMCPSASVNDHPDSDFTDVEKMLVEGIARWDLAHGGAR